MALRQYENSCAAREEMGEKVKNYIKTNLSKEPIKAREIDGLLEANNGEE